MGAQEYIVRATIGDGNCISSTTPRGEYRRFGYQKIISDDPIPPLNPSIFTLQNF